MQRRGAPHAPCFCQLRAVSHSPWLLGVMGRRVQCVGDSPTTHRQYWASLEPWPIAQGLARLDPDPGFPEEVRRQELMAGAQRPRPTRPTARSGGWGVWRPGRFQLRPVSRDAELGARSFLLFLPKVVPVHFLRLGSPTPAGNQAPTGTCSAVRLFPSSSLQRSASIFNPL